MTLTHLLQMITTDNEMSFKNLTITKTKQQAANMLLFSSNNDVPEV